MVQFAGTSGKTAAKRRLAVPLSDGVDGLQLLIVEVMVSLLRDVLGDGGNGPDPAL